MIHIHQSKKNKEFWFTIKSRNGKVIATSETYKRKDGVYNAIAVVSEVGKKLNNDPSKTIVDHTMKKK